MELTGLRGRVEYAQLLNDGSEVRTVDFAGPAPMGWSGPEESTLVLDLPVQRPPVAVPVVELFLKG